VATRDKYSSLPSNGAAAMLRRLFLYRAVWHTVGLVVALVVAWFIFRAYRQPEFLMDFMNLRLC
jgi:hypothetical protein